MEILARLGINPSLLVSQLINFGLLAFLLHRLLYKPVLNMLAQRRERIARSMKDADAAREAAGKAQLEFDRRIAEAQREAQAIVAQAAQTGEKLAAEIKTEAMRDAEAIRLKARDDAQAEKTHLLTDVQSQIASLSMAATEQVLGQSVDADVQRKLVDQFLAQLGK